MDGQFMVIPPSPIGPIGLAGATGAPDSCAFAKDFKAKS